MTDDPGIVSKHLDDSRWLQSVRDDLDTNAEVWVVKPNQGGMSKAQAIGQYLDTILTELGYPPNPHRCSVCGKEHKP